MLVLGALPAALCAALSLQRLPVGPIVGTGQDEWYNVIRALTALYERFDPFYFIHPALYYEVLAVVFWADRAILAAAGTIPNAAAFLDYFLTNEGHFLQLARSVSLAGALLSVYAAVWLGDVLAGGAAGLLCGAVIASLPLLHTMAGAIRVDTLALAALLAASALVMGYWARPSRRRLIAAAAGIGVAAAANYPGALLILVLAWIEVVRPHPARPLRRLAGACLLAGAVFLALNPYTMLDLPRFVWWFTFQARVALVTHPHGEPPSVWFYLDLLRQQGAPALLACGLGAAVAVLRLKRPAGALAAFAVLYLAVFSFMHTQYDRFGLPPIALLAAAGSAAWCQTVTWLAGKRFAAPIAVATALPVLWMSAAPLRTVSPVSAAREDDYRASMFAWILQHVPRRATLLFESDTLPLLQTVYDPGREGPFSRSLRAAFDRTYPRLPARILKTQFIGTVYNYDPTLLDGEVFFLASSRNRQYIAANRTTLSAPAAFYEKLDASARVVHETAGPQERLLLYATAEVRRTAPDFSRVPEGGAPSPLCFIAR